MVERVLDRPEQADPPLSDSQQQLKQLCDVMLIRKPNLDANFQLTRWWPNRRAVDPAEAAALLKPLSDSGSHLLLPAGRAQPTESNGPSCHRPFEPAVFEDVEATAVQVVGLHAGATGSDFLKVRSFRGQPGEPHSRWEYPSQEDWTRRLIIQIDYQVGQRRRAKQIIDMEACSRMSGDPAIVSRRVIDLEQQRTQGDHYTGNQLLTQNVSDELPWQGILAVGKQLFEVSR